MSIVTSDVADTRPLFFDDDNRQSSMYPVEVATGPIMEAFISKADAVDEVFGNVLRKQSPTVPHFVTTYASRDPGAQTPLLEHYKGVGTVEDPYDYSLHVSEQSNISLSASHTILAFANTAAAEQRPAYCLINNWTVILEPAFENGQQIVKLSVEETAKIPRSFAAIAADIDADRPIPMSEARYYEHCLDKPANAMSPETWIKQRLQGAKAVRVWFDRAQDIVAEMTPTLAHDGAPERSSPNTQPPVGRPAIASTVEIVISHVELALVELPGEIVPVNTLIGILATLEEAANGSPDGQLQAALEALREVKTRSVAANLLLGTARSDLELFIRAIG